MRDLLPLLCRLSCPPGTCAQPRPAPCSLLYPCPPELGEGISLPHPSPQVFETIWEQT